MRSCQFCQTRPGTETVHQYTQCGGILFVLAAAAILIFSITHLHGVVCGIHQNLRVKFRAIKTGLSPTPTFPHPPPHSSFPTDHSKAFSLLQCFSFLVSLWFHIWRFCPYYYTTKTYLYNFGPLNPTFI